MALQALFDMIRRFKIGYDVRAAQAHRRALAAVADRADTRATAEHAVAGSIASGGAGEHDLEALTLPDAEHANVHAEIEGVRGHVRPHRYRVDVICDAADQETVREALRNAGAEPVSEAAAEILRVERGRPRYGVDLDETVIPQEAGLNERAVSFTKGCYVGQETVARLYYKGKPNRHLRGLRLTAPAEPGAELRLGERTVGHLTSAVLSPARGPIGLALVRREAEPGASVSVGEHGVEAEVVELPFAAR